MRLDPLAWAVALYFGAQSAGFYAGLAWIPEILLDNGYSEGTAGTLQAVNSLVSMAPALVVPIIAARLGHQLQILAAVVVVASIGIVGLLLAPGAGLLWVALIGMGQGGMLGLALILPVLRARSARGGRVADRDGALRRLSGRGQRTVDPRGRARPLGLLVGAARRAARDHAVPARAGHSRMP